jgi:hypothetical protein
MFNTFFALANGVVFFWLVLIFLPKWKVTQFFVDKKVIPLYLALLYTVSIIAVIVEQGLGFINDFRSVEGVIHLLSDPHVAIACWIHILCFDSFIGHYIVQENTKRQTVALPLQSIILFFTLMFGPFGFLCYKLADWIGSRKKSVEQS